MVDNARKRLMDVGIVVLALGTWALAAWAGSRGVEIDPVSGLWHFPGERTKTITNVLAVSGPFVTFALVILTSAMRRWIALIATIAVSAAGLLLMISVGFFSSTNGIGSKQVTGADGHDYILLYSGFQDYLYYLGRVQREDAWEKVVEPIATTSDFSSPTVRLVRPANPHESRGMMTSADGRYIVLEVWTGCASIAYDTKTEERWSSESYDNGTIEDLSPFILLGPDDIPHAPDVAALRGVSGCPRSKSLDELDHAKFADHPNPAVQALVAK